MTLTGNRSEEILAQAAEWLLELQSPDLPVERIVAWQQWLGINEHAHAFDQLQRTWNMADVLASAPRETLPWPSAEELSRENSSVSSTATARIPRVSMLNPWMRGLAAIAAVMVLGIGGALWLIRENSGIRAQTGIGEHRELHLADGSTVWIGADSRLRIVMKEDARDIELERGEAYFSVAKDPVRPFSVRAGSASVTALGTAFNVRRSGRKLVIVGVSEGTVSVSPQKNSVIARFVMNRQENTTQSTRVIAGERLVLEPDSIEMPKIAAVAPRTIASWREGRLEYSGESLEAVIADINRYLDKRIVITDPSIASLRVTGSVAEANIQSWLNSLQASLPIEIETSDNGRLEVRARH